ncbi:hypothetical protein BDV97DRAFT_116260 [Delphinella strobiligena]|nr:hypothetical protein BDV97DRAFT_116260 [Delphinella strobiligena]
MSGIVAIGNFVPLRLRLRVVVAAMLCFECVSCCVRFFFGCFVGLKYRCSVAVDIFGVDKRCLAEISLWEGKVTQIRYALRSDDVPCRDHRSI